MNASDAVCRREKPVPDRASRAIESISRHRMTYLWENSTNKSCLYVARDDKMVSELIEFEELDEMCWMRYRKDKDYENIIEKRQALNDIGVPLIFRTVHFAGRYGIYEGKDSGVCGSAE